MWHESHGVCKRRGLEWKRGVEWSEGEEGQEEDLHDSDVIMRFCSVLVVESKEHSWIRSAKLLGVKLERGRVGEGICLEEGFRMRHMHVGSKQGFGTRGEGGKGERGGHVREEEGIGAGRSNNGRSDATDGRQEGSGLRVELAQGQGEWKKV